MERGSGPINNKFWKLNDQNIATVLEVGFAAHQWTVDELKEIVKIFDKSVDIEKEVSNAPKPNAKRGPGRPRKADSKADSTGEVSENGAE